MSKEIYHTGFLALDRQYDRQLDHKAEMLMRQAEAGLVILVQRLVRRATSLAGRPVYDYIAIVPERKVH